MRRSDVDVRGNSTQPDNGGVSGDGSCGRRNEAMAQPTGSCDREMGGQAGLARRERGVQGVYRGQKAAKEVSSRQEHECINHQKTEHPRFAAVAPGYDMNVTASFEHFRGMHWRE